MLKLTDYLDLSVDEARWQWRAVLSRGPSDGRNQVDYLPIETLICFGLGLVTPPSRSGVINLRSGDPRVQHFAQLFRRTPKSLAAKLANLDGRRPHSARYEKELWVILSGRENTYPELYTTILASARELDLDEHVMPDFLGVGDNRFQIVTDAVDVSDDEIVQSIATDIDQRLDQLTELARIGTARIGQQQFARRVLENSDFACVFCGLSTKKHAIRSARMLIASHIKPWSDSTNRERLDTANGLAACPTHDAAFENYLIAIDRSGRIIRSAEVRRAVASDPTWARAFGSQALASSLQLVEGAPLPGPSYVDWHWSHSHGGLEVIYD